MVNRPGGFGLYTYIRTYICMYACMHVLFCFALFFLVDMQHCTHSNGAQTVVYIKFKQNYEYNRNKLDILLIAADYSLPPVGRHLFPFFLSIGGVIRHYDY